MSGLVHRFDLRVYYEDTDAAGIVYHSNYLNFAERARTEMLRGLGFGQQVMRQRDGVGFAVRRLQVEYLRPARLDDRLTVESRFCGCGGATLDMAQRVLCDEHILATLEVFLACIGRDGRPRRLPPELRRALLPNFCREARSIVQKTP
jgi:acyl-CoA thioester hydrolase